MRKTRRAARVAGGATPSRLGILLLCLGASACSSPAEPGAGLPAPYEYTARGAGGGVLVTGELTLTLVDDSLVTGSWSTRWALGADTTTEVGPQVGHGTLAGRLHQGVLLVDLTPSNADNNAVLEGPWLGGSFVGTWTWITISGPRTSGAFTALKP